MEVCTTDEHGNMTVLRQLETESEVGAGILEYTILLNITDVNGLVILSR